MSKKLGVLIFLALLLVMIALTIYNQVMEPETDIEEEAPITLDTKPAYSLSAIESEIHNLVNNERTSLGLEPLKWNDELASIARMHSQNLAEENEPLTDFNLVCNNPILHHEGLDFGLYQDDRLHNQEIYYFNISGENLALIKISKNKTYTAETPYTCNLNLDPYYTTATEDSEIIRELEEEIQKRIQDISNEVIVNWTNVDWMSKQDIETEFVQDWMDSPKHKENILTPEYDEAGVGVAEVNDFLIATQIFITRADCGYKTGPCCEKEGYYPHCYEQWKCTNNICN